MVRVVSFGSEPYHTMDDYDAKLGENVEEDVWVGHDNFYFSSIPTEFFRATAT